MDERAVIILKIPGRVDDIDLDVPLDIAAFELISGLNEAYDLGIDMDIESNCHLSSESPVALLRGSKTLREYGIRNGSVIHVPKTE